MVGHILVDRDARESPPSFDVELSDILRDEVREVIPNTDTLIQFYRAGVLDRHYVLGMQVNNATCDRRPTQEDFGIAHDTTEATERLREEALKYASQLAQMIEKKLGERPSIVETTSPYEGWEEEYPDLVSEQLLV